MLEIHVEASDSKYSRTVEKEARAENKFRTCITSLLSELKVARDCMARFEKDRMNEHTEDRETVTSRQKALAALKDQLRDKKVTLKYVRAEVAVATSGLETLRLRAEKVKEELSIAQTDVSLQTTLQEGAREQLDGKVAELEEVHSQLEMREDELIAVHDAQTKIAAELVQLRARTANKTPESGGVQSTAEDDERPTKRAKVGRGSENSIGAPSTAAYSASLPERDGFKSRCEALMLENQCIPGLADGAKELGVKVVNIEKSNTSAKSTSTRRRNKKSPTVSGKRVIALEAELKEAQGAQKRSVEEAEKSEKRAADAATQLADSVQRLVEVEESTKLATEKRADTKLQVALSAEFAKDALRRLINSSRRAELLDKEALGLKSQLGEMVKARDFAVAESSNRQKKGKALKARVRILGDELDLLKHRESTDCDLEVMTRKVADAQGDITNMVIGLHRETVSSYLSIRRGVDRALVEVSRRLKEAFDCDARSLQQSVCEAARGAAERTRESFTNAPVAIEKRWVVIVGRAAGTDESAKSEAFSSHTAGSGAQAGASWNRPSSGRGPQKGTPPSAMPNSSGAHDPRDHSGYGA